MSEPASPDHADLARRLRLACLAFEQAPNGLAQRERAAELRPLVDEAAKTPGFTLDTQTEAVILRALPLAAGFSLSAGAKASIDPETWSTPPDEYEASKNNNGMGWVVFILIFVVGNAILYFTTGIFLIPIPRK